MKNNNLTIATLAVILFSFFYGLQTILQQTVVRNTLPPLHLNFLAYGLSFIIFLIYLVLFNRKALKIKSKKGLTFGILTGLSASVVADTFVLLGLQTSSSINWGILSRLAAFVTFVLALVFLKEKSNMVKILALIISVVGAFLVIYTPGTKIIFNRGDLLFVGAFIAFGLANIFSQKALEFLSLSQLTFLRLFSAAVVFGIIVFVFFPVKQVSTWGFIFYNAASLIVGTSLISLIIKKSSGSFFAVASNLVPVFIIILSIFFLKEYPLPIQLAGGTLIIGGVILFQKGLKKEMSV